MEKKELYTIRKEINNCVVKEISGTLEGLKSEFLNSMVVTPNIGFSSRKNHFDDCDDIMSFVKKLQKAYDIKEKTYKIKTKVSLVLETKI